MRNENSLSSIPYSYINREITFQYRKRSYTFSLSLDLFSSAGIDTGSRFLLKVFSDFLDKKIAESGGAGLFGGEAPFSVLDAGCGVGVLGICAAGALSALVSPETPEIPPNPPVLRVRAQDRDELGRLFTGYNAIRNGLNPDIFEAHAEPLLTGPAGQKWNLILTNIPAKAGLPVLEDFIHRSAGILSKNGLVFLVAVNTLAEFFRSGITAAGATLIAEETGKEHTVFIYGPGENPNNSPGSGENTRNPLIFDEKFPQSCPFYIRNREKYEIEDISYHLDTVHGAPGFDSPGGAVTAAAKLALKIDLKTKLAKAEIQAKTPNNAKNSLLIHDAGQGHIALWLVHYLEAAEEYNWILSGRNIVALATARAALATARAALTPIAPTIIPSADIYLDREQLMGNSENGDKFNLISFFPATTTEANLTETAWQAMEVLTASGGIIITGMNSMEAERFDRKKPQGFTRLADIKRDGFRALAYQKR